MVNKFIYLQLALSIITYYCDKDKCPASFFLGVNFMLGCFDANVVNLQTKNQSNAFGLSFQY